MLIASDFLDHKVLCESTSLYKPLYRPFPAIYDGYGFVNPEGHELDRLVDACIYLGISRDIIGQKTEHVARNIGHEISYGNVCAGEKARIVNFCMISDSMYCALNERLQKMVHDIDTILVPTYEQQKLEALASNDALMVSIAGRNDATALMQISVAKIMHQHGHHSLTRLAQHGLSTSGPRHAHSTLRCEMNLRDNLQEAGEIQVLSEFLSSIRGFWSPQSGQGSDRVQAADYELLEKVLSNGVNAIRLRQEA
ncbi:hypothetical protein RYA05_00120 [Pseudomonas syringae pv. actinidiae]|nr:hypothetical protein [Pseudomonas syringae pv. actinidiae]